jgi:hypothetical protein
MRTRRRRRWRLRDLLRFECVVTVGGLGRGRDIGNGVEVLRLAENFAVLRDSERCFGVVVASDSGLGTGFGECGSRTGDALITRRRRDVVGILM